MKTEWKDLDRNDVCKNCEHPRKDHDDMEKSLGNDSHECENVMTIGGTRYQCICDRFE